MSYYPIFVDLKGKTVLVVGGGRVAQRKIETLLGYGAEIRLVTREVTESLKLMITDKKIQHVGTNFKEDFLRGVSLVFAATDDTQVNHRVSKAARERGLWVNAVDQPVDCSFIVPSIVRRGDLAIAVSTMGKSPALAKEIREQLELQFDDAYSTFLALMGAVRSRVLGLSLSQQENSRIFGELVSSDILKSIRDKNLDAVEADLERILPADLDAADILTHVGKESRVK